jgi:hypothetical protein
MRKYFCLEDLARHDNSLLEPEHRDRLRQGRDEELAVRYGGDVELREVAEVVAPATRPLRTEQHGRHGHHWGASEQLLKSSGDDAHRDLTMRIGTGSSNRGSTWVAAPCIVASGRGRACSPSFGRLRAPGPSTPDAVPERPARGGGSYDARGAPRRGRADSTAAITEGRLFLRNLRESVASMESRADEQR